MRDRTVGLLIAMALTVSACSQTTRDAGNGIVPGRGAPAEVVAVHYATPPPFLVNQPKSVGRAMLGGAAAALFSLPFGPLAPIVGGELARGLQAHMEKTEAEAAGELLSLEIPLEDPVARVKERLIARLNAGGEIGRIRPVAAAMGSDALESLKQTLGPTTVLDVKTVGWGLTPFMEESKAFIALYRVRARLLRLDTAKVVRSAEVTCVFAGDRRFGAPTLEELKAEGGRLLNSGLGQAAEDCVEPLLARLQGRELPRPVPSAGLDVTVDPSTLAEAEAKLGGPGGLVAGAVRFDAKFKGVALATHDLQRLRTILKDATGSPWGSEVQFRGTIDGAPFKAKMDKRRSGWVEFGFEGVYFDDETQARAFLAPLAGRGVREVKLRGVAGGEPLAITLKPTAAWSAPGEPEPAVAGPPPARSDSPAAPATVSRTSLPPGDLQWPPAGSTHVLAVRTTGSFGSGRREMRVTYLGERTWQGKRVHVFSDGSSTRYYDSRRRLLAHALDGALVEAFDPYLVFADWPIAVGRWWPNRYRYTDHGWNRSFDDVRYDGKVEAYGDVTTPAGTFKAFRIALQGHSSTTVLWYSSDLAIVVKARITRLAHHYRGAGTRTVELLSHDFGPADTKR